MYLASAVARPPMEGHATLAAFVTHAPDYPVLRRPGCVSDPALPQQQSYSHNGALYPDVFASAYSCHFRPQLTTPPPKVKMSVRPSSSRGPGSQSSSSNSFKYDKRISRDDSFVNFRSGAGGGIKPYSLARGQLPTPEASPRPSPPRKASIPTIRMPTPESLNESHPAEIGMALGSPTTTPVHGLRTPQNTLRVRNASNPSLVSPASGYSTTGSLPRKQSGKWKLFSRFGKKQSDHSHPGPSEQKATHKPEQPQDMASQHWYDTKVERSNTTATRGTPRHKPLVVRSQTMPYDTENPAQKSKSTLSEKKSQETFGRIPIALDTHQNSSGPLLDVEIPRITMERYSVMFGSVLQSQPSLLARRQATVQKLKSIDDAIEKEEQEGHHDIPRRASSPQPTTKSPPLALFPPTPPQKHGYHPSSNASPRLRSNTSPAHLPSPSRETFDHSRSRQQPSHDVQKAYHHKGHSIHTHPRGKLTIATLARAREQQAAEKDVQFSPDSSKLILESPSEMSSPEFEVVRTEGLRPRPTYTQEPKWQMMTPPQHTPPSTTSTSATSDKKPLPSSPETSAQSNPSQVSDDEDDIVDSSKMNPVELSIARQISISRQQRKMLKPLQTGSGLARTQRSPSKTSPAPRIAMGKNERLAETKSSTPTLITPEEISPGGHSPLARHRKSERVVLERA
ncbi:uncharacterized protein F4822DRAFT_36566 [Hypoxylon trugodes]|uniref:uncharacterized protein n=1 Tax=Hypoxylon trugodes TaxID=326681 RepID=UPI002190D5F0|nr:uncharacterized protein F4822DRAFT_36566 [Hypoxylon trugodes]KAI1394095.1 hypothetical protein F4822DRAFT_36566 [Hypoxylon trugodes]